MKYLGIAIIVLSLVVGIAPQFLDCQSQGRALALANGNTVPMKCHWTAIASIGLAVPLAATGGFNIFSKRKETRRALSILGIILGAFVILTPTALIGVCTNNMMLCKSIMQPMLILGGTLIIVLSGIMLIPTFRKGVEPEL